MRLFLAVNLPDSIKDSLAGELPRFDYLKFRLIPRDNWHVTVKFMDEVTSDKLPLIQESVEPVRTRFKPFELTIKDVGFLNRRIFAFNLERSPKLFALFKIIDERLASRGVCRRERFRAFSPHITVGRKNPALNSDLHSVRHFDLKARHELSFTVKSIDVMESTLADDGAIYRLVESYSIS